MARPDHPRPSASGARPRASRHGGAGGTLLGVFIGLVLGLGLAAGVAYYLMAANGPFPAQGGAKDAREAAREPTKLAKADRPDGGTDKPRFDFYKILPGTEEAKVQPERKAQERTDRAVAGEAKEKQAPKAAEAAQCRLRRADRRRKSPPPSRPGGALRRAVLAAGGLVRGRAGGGKSESAARAGGLGSHRPAGHDAGQGVRYRVRLGPYDNADELNRIKTELGRRGFDAAVIKY